tara:strand:- start:264 stop:428 length:165 start_codon:yes stop_codon:yes gene_type:complete
MRKKTAVLPEELILNEFLSFIKWMILSGVLYWAFGPDFTMIIFLAIIAHRLGPR